VIATKIVRVLVAKMIPLVKILMGTEFLRISCTYKILLNKNCEKCTCIYECTKFLICQALQDTVFQFLLSGHLIEWHSVFPSRLLCQSYMAFTVNKAVVKSTNQSTAVENMTVV
jgi:hypothetical protein